MDLEAVRRDRKLAAVRRLGEAAGLTDESLVDRVQALGFTAETVVLLDLLPAIEVAWAEGVLTQREREAVYAIAAELGVGPCTPARLALDALLATPCEEAYFVEARDVLAAAIDEMPEMEARMRRMDIVDYCREVAAASGGLRAKVGLGDRVSPEERETIGRVAARLGWRRNQTLWDGRRIES